MVKVIILSFNINKIIVKPPTSLVNNNITEKLHPSQNINILF